jgi:hypothetical protein
VIKIKDSQNYIFADGDQYPTYRIDTPYDKTDTKFHFVFVKYNKTTYDDNSKIYFIKSVSSGLWATYFKTSTSTGEPAVEFARSQSYQNALWIVKKDGDTFKIIRAKYNNGFYENSNECWSPSIGYPISISTSPLKSLVIEALDDSEVGGGESGGNEGGGESGEAIDYSVNFNTTYAASARRFSSITLNSPKYGNQSVSPNGTYIYSDKTSTTFKIEAGEEVSITTNPLYSWIFGYVYIDTDYNGFTAGIAADGYTPTGDMVSYSFYGSETEENSGRNSKGAYISGEGRANISNPPSFIAPTKPGTYRMRIKFDWNSIDPKGDNNPNFNGTITSTNTSGTIIDVMVEVVAKPVAIDLSLSPISSTDNLLYGLTGYIGTFSAAYKTEIPEGVTAYYASAVNGTESIKLTELVKNATDEIHGLPANFGVILVASPEYSNIVDGKAVVTMSPTDKHFQTAIGNNEFGNSAGGDVVMGDNCYVLAKGTDGIGFYLATKGTTLKAGKAYIEWPNSNPTSALRLVLDETVTGINGVATEKVDAPIYDLSGRRVLNTVKGGIYIQNGKKFIVK